MGRTIAKFHLTMHNSSQINILHRNFGSSVVLTTGSVTTPVPSQS
jgi:hypothetical protein